MSVIFAEDNNFQENDNNDRKLISNTLKDDSHSKNCANPDKTIKGFRKKVQICCMIVQLQKGNVQGGNNRQMKRRKIVRWLLFLLATVFMVVNVIACFHVYKFMHFTTEQVTRTKDAKQLSTGEKIKILFCGIDNPRPKNSAKPSEKFETIILQSNRKIECWSIKVNQSKGTVILFHGYCSEKSSMLRKSDEFLKLGYNTFLVDFMGSGGSEGNHTTFGFKEAEEVKTCFDFLARQGERNIYLFGTSMGAVAILKAVQDYQLQPAAIILECPFGSMYRTTCSRLKILKIPVFPMAGILNFWGSVQNGFCAFSHRPTEYAKSIRCPVLLLYGEKDEKVSRAEIDEIYANLAGKKELIIYPLAGHKNYLEHYQQKWAKDIDDFINTKGK